MELYTRSFNAFCNGWMETIPDMFLSLLKEDILLSVQHNLIVDPKIHISNIAASSKTSCRPYKQTTMLAYCIHFPLYCNFLTQLFKILE